MVEKIGDLKALGQKIQKVNTLLFDLDGTLVSTDYANFLSYKKAIELVVQSQSLAINPSKRITREAIRTFIPNLSEEDYEKIIKIKERLYPDFLHETRLNRTVASILEKNSDKEIILVTNSRQERATMLLNHHNISGKFDHCFYRENMKSSRNKFQKVLSVLQIPASSVIVFENSESEIDAAIAIGITSENIFAVV